jgi:hypothetical protein
MHPVPRKLSEIFTTSRLEREAALGATPQIESGLPRHV